MEWSRDGLLGRMRGKFGGLRQRLGWSRVSGLRGRSVNGMGWCVLWRNRVDEYLVEDDKEQDEGRAAG